MKIAFLANKSSVHACRWANELSLKGHEIHFFFVKRGNEVLIESVKEHKLRWKPPLGFILNIFQLRKELKEIKPEMLHVHYATGNAFLGVISKFQPMLLSVYGSDVLLFPEKSLFHRSFSKFILKKASHLSVTSNVLKIKTQELIGKKKNIKLNPFGVDTVKFKPRQEENDKRDYLVIGTIKKIAPTYGIDLLIRSFFSLLEDKEFIALNIPVKLLIVGDGIQLPELKQLVNDLGISDRVIFNGKVAHTEVAHCLSQIDIFVALSRSESFGVSVLEASASGIPVIVSNVGGLPEVVKNGETGIIVESDNIQEAKKAMHQLVTNDPLRIEMGKKGRSLVVSKFDWQHCVSLMEENYLEIVS